MTSLTSSPSRRGRQLPRRAARRRTLGNSLRSSPQRRQKQTPHRRGEHPAEVIQSLAQPAQRLSKPAKKRAEVLWYDREFNLDERFPIAERFSLRKSYPWLILAVVSFVSFVWFHGLFGFGQMEDTLTRVHYTVFRVSLVGLLLSVCYWEVYRRNFSYRTEGFRLVIERGIFFKVYASVPLLPVADILIKRNFADMLFGVFNVSILIPVNCGEHLCTIPCLTREMCFGLHGYLSEQLNNQVFVADAAINNVEAPTSS